MDQITPTTQIVHQFLNALVSSDLDVFDFVLRSDVLLDIQYIDRSEIYWTRPHVRTALLAESAAWTKPMLTIRECEVTPFSVLVTFQIMATENGRVVSHNYSATITIRRGQIDMITLFHDGPASTRPLVWFMPVRIPVANEKEVG